MKKFLKRNLIALVLAVVGLLVSFVPVAARIEAENENEYYDVIIDYGSLKRMVYQSAYDIDYWLELFKDLGINKVALYELTALDMAEDPLVPVYAEPLSDILIIPGWEQDYPETVVGWLRESTNPGDALIATENLETYEWVLSAYTKRGEGFECLTHTENGKGYIFINEYPGGFCGKDWLNMCLGMWPETMELIASHGMTVIPRTTTVEKMNSYGYAESFLAALEESGSPYFIGGGDALPGADDEESIKLLIDYLNESGKTVGLIEENDQSQNLTWDGMEDVLAATDNNAVRVFNVWPYIQNRYEYYGYEGPEEITNSLFRAVVERNCKVVYMKMILDPDNDVSVDADEEKWIYETEPEDYIQLFEDLYRRLGAQGYEMADAVPAMELSAPSAAVRALQGIGTVAAVVLLLDMIFIMSRKWRYGLLIIGAVCAVGGAFVLPGAYKVLLSMASGIVMPCIAGVGLCRYMADKRKDSPGQPRFINVLGYSIVVSVVTMAVAFCGSVMVAGSLSEMAYLLETELYRGVKIMQLIPIAMFALGYLLVFIYEESGAKAALLAHIGVKGDADRREKIKAYWSELMAKDVKLGWIVFILAVAVVAVVILAAGVYYIYRTGNSMNVSGTELMFRNVLENLLAARPRTKEILIGWPCLMLFVWSLRRHMKYLPMVFGLAMSIGLVSVVNTFLHIRTPFMFSLLRTGWGMLFGIIIGIAFVVIAELLYRLITGKNGGKKNV